MPDSGAVDCATNGLNAVERLSQSAVAAAAQGDQAAAAGDPGAAQSDYAKALGDDSGNADAQAGLLKVGQETPNRVRESRDWWNQFVSNTLQPVGQFFLWLLTVIAAGYILYLLTRILARWQRLPLPAWPAGADRLQRWTWMCLTVAALAAVATAVTAAAGLFWGVWMACLSVAMLLTLAGCALGAWYLRSGVGVQFTVVDAKGDPDKDASAALAGYLNALGGKPYRGFDLPQSTDVTKLSGALTVLPGGGMLSSLIGFLLVQVPVSPWNAVVTLIDSDRLLVSLRQNGSPPAVTAASLSELFFPGSDFAQQVKNIEQVGPLVTAAAVILTGMAQPDNSPLRAGLNGARTWQSVAGQVLATSPEFTGKDDLNRALLARATDFEPGNLAAQVAQAVMDGRRAGDTGNREAFAERINVIAGQLKPEYQALNLRVYYSAAAGWGNVYLDGDERVGAHLKQAVTWANRLMICLGQLASDSPRETTDDLRKLAGDMRPSAYQLIAGLAALRRRRRNMVPALRADYRNWGAPEPATSGELYAAACQRAAQHTDDGDEQALEFLRRAATANDDLRGWARLDPSFRHIAASQELHQKFVKIVSEPAPPGFTAVGPLAAYTAKLTAIGVHTAADLMWVTRSAVGQQEVAKAAGVSPLAVARWCDIAELSALAEGPSLSQLNALVAQGLDSAQALRKADPATREKAAAASVNSLGQFTPENIVDWAQAAAVP